MKWYVSNDTVYVVTKHFTKFIVTDSDETHEVNDAVITVAASIEKANSQWLMSLRVMLHTNCLKLRDFASKRREV